MSHTTGQSKYDAVLFDMDGLLIDSMKHWIALDQNWFRENGRELTDADVLFLTGKSMRENLLWLKGIFNLDTPIEQLMKERIAQTDEIYNTQTQPMLGALELLQAIDNSSLVQAIASGSSQARIKKVVERFSWASYFDSLWSADDVDCKGKPAPDVYLAAAAAVGVDPSRCVVFEDAANGLQSAKAAGMDCIVVPQEAWSPGDFSDADLSVSTLEDKKIYEFIGL